MQIQRRNGTRDMEELLRCRLYVRKNLTVVKAFEWYYTFVGENSYLPVSSLITPEDGELLLKKAEEETDEVEMFTVLSNGREDFRNIYLRMEKSNETEEGKPLLLITLFDVRDMENRSVQIEKLVIKYRHFMNLQDQFFFEYTRDDNKIVIYKYMNERSIKYISCSLEEFAEQMHERYKPGIEQKEQMELFCAYLKKVSPSFEMEFTMDGENGGKVCRVKGGTLYNDKNMVSGILCPGSLSEREKYYLTPAARDAGTGVFNKRAAMEYTVEKLRKNDDTVRWLVLLDIDDFKNINDTFGHLFGDEVINRVAEILQVDIGNRGIVGRFGGDEFFMLLEKIPDNEALRNLLKTAVKQINFAFDPKLKVTASIGIAQYPVDGSDYEELFAKADLALYLAKEKGKNRFIIYDKEIHGTSGNESMKNMAVAYAVSKEKRREALADILSTLILQGAESITKQLKLQKQIRDLFDLDGMLIYTDYGRQLVCQSGQYNGKYADMEKYMADTGYTELFGKEGLLVETTMVRTKAGCPKLYAELSRCEVKACVQCLEVREGKPYALVSFDVFNRNRKWSDGDVELLSIIGKCIGRLL